MNTLRTSSALALAAASVLSGLTSTLYAADTAGAVTVSLSGSTAMRNFTVSDSFTSLTPGATININGQSYTAIDSGLTNYQLAYNGATPDTYTASAQTVANYIAYRVEWHEQGSVEGIGELVNDQIGYYAGQAAIDNSTRNPVPSPGNRIYVQRNPQTATSAAGGFTVNFSNYDTYANYNAAGTNLQGGQNRVQMAISDVRSSQGFSIPGAAAFDRRAGQAGYGKGNPVLLTAAAPVGSAGSNLGLGSSQVRRQLIDVSALNMQADGAGVTGKIDPKTGAKYAAGPWNSAGLDNTTNKTVAVTATTFAANPGTGLTDLNKSDAQWLQTTGRLANGANFNVTTRDINSGTLNVAANNVGIDPSFAVGENDAGNGTGSVNETVVGPNIKFSGKTAGGGQLRPTLQAARMAVGHLSLSDVQSVAQASATNPLRALGFRNTLDNTGAAVKVSFDSISDGSYALFQNETYVTIKDPTNGAAKIAAYKALPGNSGLSDAQAWAAMSDADTGIKGDNSGNDVRDLRDNILNSVAGFPANSAFRSPANGLVTTGFIPTKFMQVHKAGDGEAVVPNPGFDSANYNAVKTASGQAFVVADASAVTSGSSSTSYGTGTNAIPVTSTNYLFGDFDTAGAGLGKRDFSDLAKAAAAQATLGTANTDYTTGGNSTIVYNGLTKGDLIVKGDYNADGKFDGRDLNEMARGTALADAGKTGAALVASPATGTLTTASGSTTSDQYRGGVLYKNAALDYLNANTTADQKLQATASVANDPTGANAFNKFDINRDGKVNVQDAAIVDGFVGKDYRNLNDQLGAVVATNVNAAGTVFVGDPTLDQTTGRRSISLVDVELNDTGDIAYASDFKLIHDNLVAGGKLFDGDADLNGTVNFNDFLALQNNFGFQGKWSQGNFDFDTDIDFNDFLVLQNNFGFATSLTKAQASIVANWAATVPEPTSIAMLAVGAAGLLRRRRA